MIWGGVQGEEDFICLEMQLMQKYIIFTYQWKKKHHKRISSAPNFDGTIHLNNRFPLTEHVHYNMLILIAL